MHLKRTLAAAVTTLFLLPGAACAAEIPASPSTFSSVFANAQPGDTIVLASGDYGTFRGGTKAGPQRVTIRPEGGASVTMRLDFQPAANLTVEGPMTLGDVDIGGAATKNVTVSGANITGQVVIRTVEMANSNVVIEDNTLRGQNVCSGCFDGRITLPQRNERAPSGVVIRENLFSGGTMDGILNGSNGTVIERNTFENIRQTSSGDEAHTDAIQLYGSKNTVIRGNWFQDVAICVMAPDGSENELLEDNVCKQDTNPGGLVGAVQFGAARNLTIRHNTFWDSGRADCSYNSRCGIVSLGGKGTDKGSNIVVADNILAHVSRQGSTPDQHHNLVTSAGPLGANDLSGTAVYEGGGAPSTYHGFRLAASSPGRGNASDGTDRGARLSTTPPRAIGGSATAPPATVGTSPAAGAPSTTVATGQPQAKRPRVRLLSSRRAFHRRSRMRLRVWAPAAGVMTLRSTLVDRARPKTRRLRLRTVKRLRFERAGARTITLSMPPRAQHRLRRWKKPALLVRASPRGHAHWVARRFAIPAAARHT